MAGRELYSERRGVLSLVGVLFRGLICYCEKGVLHSGEGHSQHRSIYFNPILVCYCSRIIFKAIMLWVFRKLSGSPLIIRLVRHTNIYPKSWDTCKI